MRGTGGGFRHQHTKCQGHMESIGLESDSLLAKGWICPPYPSRPPWLGGKKREARNPGGADPRAKPSFPRSILRPTH
jgi:hypothetical protein